MGGAGAACAKRRMATKVSRVSAAQLMVLDVILEGCSSGTWDGSGRKWAEVSRSE